MSGRLITDLRTARNRVDDPGIDGIVTVDHGQGQIVMTYIHVKLETPIQVCLVPSDPAAYPDDNKFLLHCLTDELAVTTALEQLQNYTFGQTVFESLRVVATGLTRALANSIDIDQDGDISMDDASSADDSVDDIDPDSGSNDEDGLPDYGSDDDDIFGLREHAHQNCTHVPPKMACGVLDRIKSDLRKCREAGAKIGIFAGVIDDARTHTISLSIRARKLGISDEALEAWDVDPADYIVLLLQVDEPYPSAEQLLSQTVVAFSMSFRFGKCNRYKPSAESVRRAFVSKGASPAARDMDEDDHPFSQLFLSSSIELFMNESLLSMFKLRLTGHPTWDAANTEMQDINATRYQDDVTEYQAGKGEVKGKGKEMADSSADTHDQQTLPTILTWDSFAEPPVDISMPLVAFQFALHYFVRCTQYCLRCHRKVDKNFEALKPYVCQNPLCLFQYITVGFGPSVEHEILTQPYVVDLLVTLCYASISAPLYSMGIPVTADRRSQSASYPIRTFPNGLHLKVPSVLSFAASSLPPSQPDQVSQEVPESVRKSCIPIILSNDRRSFTIKEQADVRCLKAGSWVVLRKRSDPDTVQILDSLQHAMVYSFDIQTQSGILELPDEISSTYQTPRIAASALGPASTYHMDLYPYDCDFDDLDDHGKAHGMKLIMDTIPPITQLREWLTRNAHSRLKSYRAISLSAVTLLEWIIASNRSFILQVSHVEDYTAKDRVSLKSIKTREQEVIPGLGNKVVQFRLAMGNPDKELRFHRALKEEQAQLERGSPSHAWPSLFAWHGSSLQNWHSILRHGLDYSKVMNGRAFGNGVYFSPDYGTSMAYTTRMSAAGWPKSVLNPNGVMALCEIINSPSKFVSTKPHYVVSQLDWIQCRYLFVQSGTNHTSGSSPYTSNYIQRSDELLQDPGKQVLGPDGFRLRIPQNAVLGNRLVQNQPEESAKSSPKRAYDVQEFCDDTDEEEATDLEALSSTEELNPSSSLKRSHLGSLDQPGYTRNSSVDSIAARQMTENRPLTPPKLSIVASMSDFRPGTLDLKSIPQLALPFWANGQSAKRLAGDIKMMQKVQANTPLHELGWYIDFDNIDNMFQWIVELHTFDPMLPLAQDMKSLGITSVVLELRFGQDYPVSPPFVRVIRPKFLPYMDGGGGHITIGGAICMEMLTNTGWNPTMSLEAVLVSIKAAISSLDPQPARILQANHSRQGVGDYNAFEALDAFQRYAARHGWQVPKDAMASATQQYKA